MHPTACRGFIFVRFVLVFALAYFLQFLFYFCLIYFTCLFDLFYMFVLFIIFIMYISYILHLDSIFLYHTWIILSSFVMCS